MKKNIEMVIWYALA